ncbi:MAG: YqiJ family protein [Pseudomonadota bacterium]|nr:YqiJ family protein [Pseudomonadota bacterium]
MEFLFATQNLAFTVALALLALLVLVELGFGGGLTEYLDTLVPDLELDADGQPAATHSLPAKLLGWLRAGKVPVFMLVGIFLGIFGVCGLLMQMALVSFGIGLLPGLLAAVLMFLLSMPFVRVAASLLGDLLPRDETQVLSQQALIGRIAVIVIGTARGGAPAQAKLRDEFRTTHYLMVEPMHDLDVFEQGEEVLLMAKDGARYRAVRADIPSIQDPPALENK